MSRKNYVMMNDLVPDTFKLHLSTEKNGKASIHMSSEDARDIAFVSPACVTHWPRCTGDGNFGTMWGPSDMSKAKFTLDLTDTDINGTSNEGFNSMANTLEAIDDKLLEFVFQNQLKILGRKQLSKEEVKMLQIRSVRAKYDKTSGALTGHSFQLNTSKFMWDGMGSKYAKKINVCDHVGTVIPNGTVTPGDVVAATVYLAQVYTGVGGDKFGMQWSFNDVSIICQRNKLEVKKEVSAFSANTYNFAVDYEEPQAPPFSDPILT